MRITISGMNMVVSGDTRAYAEYRIFSAVAPHAANIKSLDLVLARADTDDLPVHCTVRIDLVPSGHIRTQASGVAPTKAVDRAADRAGWHLRRRSGRMDFTMKAAGFNS